MNLINLTPHPIHVLTQHGDPIVTIPSSGEARLAVSRVIAGRLALEREPNVTEGIPVFASEFGVLSGLPDEPAPDTAYIVSRLVADYAAARPEMEHWPLLVPDFVVRDEKGAIVGCQGFAVTCGYEQARGWRTPVGVEKVPGIDGHEWYMQPVDRPILSVDRYGPDEWGTAIGPEAGRLIRSPDQPALAER